MSNCNPRCGPGGEYWIAFMITLLAAAWWAFSGFPGI